MFGFKTDKIKIWILALVAGVVGGFLLATRLNLLAPSKAEHEIKKASVVNEQVLENNFVSVAKEVGPAVVSISTEHTEKIGGRSPRGYFRFFGDQDGFGPG